MNFAKTSAHKTRLAAFQLERKVYASLPWGYRVAQAMLRIASSESRLLGATFIGLMKFYGTENLPEFSGGELPSPNPGETRKHFIDRFLKLTRKDTSFGNELGKYLYGTLLRKFKNPETVDDLIQGIWLKILDDQHAFAKDIARGGTYKGVRQLLLISMVNAAFNLLKAKGNKNQGMLVDEEGIESDFEDPNSWKAMADMIPQHELDALTEEIQEAAPPAIKEDLPLYFELLLDGVKDSTIYSHRLLPFMRKGTRAEHMDVDDLMAMDADELVFFFQDAQGKPVKNPAGVVTTLASRFKEPIQKAVKKHFSR